VPRKLKVFRTPIGFHDAYVAAPSQKAALEAWGSDSNLFARGAAEEVTDPELTKAPLEQPGVVFRRLRGSAKEQMEALGKGGGQRAEAPSPQAHSRTRKKGKRPSRAALTKAEAALEAAREAQAKAMAALEEKERALQRERRELEQRHARAVKAAEEKEREAREAYQAAVAEWEGE
jgi:hypothetical protein